MDKRWIFLGLGLVIYGTVVTYTDPLLLTLLVYVGLFWFVAPCAGIALCIFFFAVATRRWLRPPLLMLRAVFVIACLIGLTLPINGFIQERAVAAAKAYPDHIAPLLEAYRKIHGVYPTNLDEIPSKPSVPRLLRSSYGYRSDGNHYTFCFPEPGGMIDVWDYDSRTKLWHLST